MTPTNVVEADLLGRRLTGVRYDMFAWDDLPTAESSVDAVPMAVILSFNGLNICLRWNLEPPSEQLVMLTETDLSSGPLVRRVDVSERWHDLLNAQLVRASWAEHETGEGVQPWAVTFDFARAGGLVVALGELIDGLPSYLPDSLLVTADRDVALRYRPPGALTPAWTDRSR